MVGSQLMMRLGILAGVTISVELPSEWWAGSYRTAGGGTREGLETVGRPRGWWARSLVKGGMLGVW